MTRLTLYKCFYYYDYHYQCDIILFQCDTIEQTSVISSSKIKTYHSSYLLHMNFTLPVLMLLQVRHYGYDYVILGRTFTIGVVVVRFHLDYPVGLF